MPLSSLGRSCFCRIIALKTPYLVNFVEGILKKIQDYLGYIRSLIKGNSSLTSSSSLNPIFFILISPRCALDKTFHVFDNTGLTIEIHFSP